MAEMPSSSSSRHQSPDPFVIDEQAEGRAEHAAATDEPAATAAGTTAKDEAAGNHQAGALADEDGPDAQPAYTTHAQSGVGHDAPFGANHSYDGGQNDSSPAFRPSSANPTSPNQMSERGAQTTAAMQSSTFVDASAAPELGHDAIQIVDAQKTSDGVGASPYIAYLIQCGALSAKRRYSEFASLRDALVALHPTLIIPPIPSKHSITDYAARQAKAKEDAAIVARRKRMLQVFLNRVKDHDKLNRSVVFRRFLDGRWSWHEITSSPPLSMLPKSNLRAPANDPASPHASPAYLALPLPPSSGVVPLKHPNQRFLDSEAFTERFRNHIQGSLEKTNRRVAKRWAEASNDYAELGAVLNEFSLSESGLLASAIERTGQAADSTFIAIGQMLTDWEARFTEPLNEYSQFATVLQKLLRWRHQKHLQFEMAQDALEAKRLQLEDLERVEAEASRLNRALESGGRGLVHSSSSQANAAHQTREGVWDSVNSRANTMRKSVYGSAAEQGNDAGDHASAKGNVPPGAGDKMGDSEEWLDPSTMSDSNGPSRPTSPPTATNGGNAFGGPASRQQPPTRNGPLRHTRRGVGGGSGTYGSGGHGSGGAGGAASGLLGALSQTFQAVMDVDPETTRRNTISRLKDNCAQLEEALELTERDLRYATLAIQSDLDRFQRQKIRDLRAMALAFAEVHREYCRAGLESWKEAKREVDAITDQTPLPESSLVRHQQTLTGGNAGSSSATANVGGGGGGGSS